MTGLFLYSGLAFGIGCWLPAPRAVAFAAVGIRFLGGYAGLVALVYVCHILGSVPLGLTLTIAAVAAGGGAFWRLYRDGWKEGTIRLFSHPALLLIAGGAAAIWVNGGIDYIPYTNDEFSFWLSTPQLIHLGGGWAAVKDTLHHSGYLPGWQLMLLLPWQLSGTIHLGQSAAAPFVFHVALIALIFDLAVALIIRRTGTSLKTARLLGWLFVLLFLAAQGMGLLWIYTILIEQPQIYGYAAVFLLLFAAEIWKQDHWLHYGIAGLVLLAAYLFKNAALSLMPALFLVSIWPLFDQNLPFSVRVRHALLNAVLLMGPTLAAHTSWAAVSIGGKCVNSPLQFILSAEQTLSIQKDWQGLAVRLAHAIWNYVVGYKIALSFAAAIGFFSAISGRKYRSFVAVAAFAATYFAALYWYHLGCFGDYDFENLNSVERFSRVPLQVFHGVGLVLLLDGALRVSKRFTPNLLITVDADGLRKWPQAVCLLAVALLTLWEGRNLLRSVEDMSTRNVQNVDSQITETRRAAIRIQELRADQLPHQPLLTILAQGRDKAAITYARYFSINTDGKGPNRLYRVHHHFSWHPTPANTWQQKATADQVAAQLGKSDIIWPIKLDPWLRGVLVGMIPDPECLASLPAKALIREKPGAATPQFRCIEK
ncbi:MAG: hypothetical protein ISR44_10285 [Rhodospirillales bacterium]|nr:hypothetical protein [Rhodospirillales bacterium]